MEDGRSSNNDTRDEHNDEDGAQQERNRKLETSRGGVSGELLGCITI